MNSLAPVSATAAPAPSPPRLRRTIHWLVSGAHLSGGRVHLLTDRVLDAATRMELEHRLGDLQRSLDQRDDRSVAAAITGLTMLFGSARMDDVDDTATIVRMYLQALSDLPAWAVIAAIEALGRPTDGRRHEFAPTEATIHALAFQRCQPWIRERQEIRTILSAAAPAAPPAADERVKVDAMIGDLAASLRMDAATTSLAEQRAEVERREREKREAAERAARLAEDARSRGDSPEAQPDAVALAVATALSANLRRPDGSPPSLEAIAAAVAAELRGAGFVAADVERATDATKEEQDERVGL